MRHRLPVVLASASPRRRDLLRLVVRDFEVVTADLDEAALTSGNPWHTAERLALAKARAVATLRPDSMVIGGDTVVAFESAGGWTQLAKPVNEADARSMLAQLGGRDHVVITGLAVVSPTTETGWTETARVRFRPLSSDEIGAYVATGEPMDKAGAYAIQGGAAGFVESLDGDIETVIGLPTASLRTRLGELEA